MSLAPKLDPKLRQDTYLMGMLAENYLLLNKNSLYPWFILVPATEEIEFYKLPKDSQLTILDQINGLSEFIEKNFNSSKLNIATIGNVVSQLHIHIIGRHPQDACWPGVVWGNDKTSAYDSDQIKQIQQKLVDSLGEIFEKTEAGI